MSAAPNYARMKGPGDFAAPDAPDGWDDRHIRDLLESSPRFVAEAIAETDVNPVAIALIAGDAIEVARLLNVAVSKVAGDAIANAIERHDENPLTGTPDGDVDPWKELEREYGDHLKRIPVPMGPRPLDMQHFARTLLGIPA